MCMGSVNTINSENMISRSLQLWISREKAFPLLFEVS